MSAPVDVAELGAGVLAKHPLSVARAISIVEDRRAASEPRIIELLRWLGAQGRSEKCHRVGITGPPGVGKSTLVSAFARELRARGKSVGVLAVDPSSPRSGGALLGDRARIAVEPSDHEMYVRSMASGGHLGGLARAAGAAVDVLSAAFDVVVIETTGVGQSETDVEHVADSVVLVIQPASGDVLQFLKSGIVEIPDLFVVNKADLGDLARRTGSELEAALSALGAAARPGWRPRVIFTSGASGTGMVELADAIDAHRIALDANGELRERRISKSAAWALRLFQQRFGEVGVDAAGGSSVLLQKLSRHVRDGMAAVEAVSACAAAR